MAPRSRVGRFQRAPIRLVRAGNSIPSLSGGDVGCVALFLLGWEPRARSDGLVLPFLPREETSRGPSAFSVLNQVFRVGSSFWHALGVVRVVASLCETRSALDLARRHRQSLVSTRVLAQRGSFPSLLRRPGGQTVDGQLRDQATLNSDAPEA